MRGEDYLTHFPKMLEAYTYLGFHAPQPQSKRWPKKLVSNYFSKKEQKIMSFDHQSYNTDYLEETLPTSDAGNYGVQIMETSATEGETYWRVIGVHHLTPSENRGNRHVFIEALDEEGRRVQGPFAWAGWDWEGRRQDEVADPIPLDKPVNEPAGNIPMHFGQKVSVWIKGTTRQGTAASDKVQGIHTAHADEPGPGGVKWNSVGHHSFYVVFQRTRKSNIPTDGVIKGQIQNGAGYTVRISQGNTVLEQQVDSQNAFKFERLRYGPYRLEAIPPTIVQDNIRLSADDKEETLNLVVG
jgi:hypothetical protein